MERSDSDTVQNDHIFPFMKDEEVFIYWVYIDIFYGLGWVRVLVMDEMSLEV